ncbi:MAG: hypothetical protein K9K75_00520 [Deltaproteobacteria bacterium]|nr:hypothetical protein [Deltaproteobacteria bacterium]
MKKNGRIALSVLAFFSFAGFIFLVTDTLANQTKDSSCVRCHTNAETLQQLHIVDPKLLEPAGEG